jgi:hypothetical protein
MAAESERLATEILRSIVLPVTLETGAVVVDGGTDSGTMRALGTAAEQAGWTGPLVGVAVASLVAAPGEPAGDRVPLEPHHTHALLVQGDAWGDESRPLADLAAVLANGAPTVTLLINGGDIGRADVQHSLRLGRPVFVLRGSGRLADELAERGDGVTVLDPGRPFAEQQQLLREVLSRPER